MMSPEQSEVSELICFGFVWMDDILCTAINGVALAVAVAIGLLANYQSIDLKRKDHQKLSTMFSVACVFSCICSIGGIGQNAGCYFAENKYLVKWGSVLVSFSGCYLLLQCILCVFTHRLDVTFRDTTYELSNTKRKIIWTLFLMDNLLYITAFTVTSFLMFATNRDSESPLVFSLWLWIMYLSSVLLLCIVAIWTVTEFCRNLLRTAKSYSLYSETEGLDTKQMQIIDVSAKYLSLYMFANVCTIIHFSVFSFLYRHEMDTGTFMGIDCIVNLICLYLQLPFCDSYYYKYCRKVDICCRWIMMRNLGKHDQAIKADRGIETKSRTCTVDEEYLAAEIAAQSADFPSKLDTVSQVSSTTDGCDQVTIQYTSPNSTTIGTSVFGLVTSARNSSQAAGSVADNTLSSTENKFGGLDISMQLKRNKSNPDLSVGTLGTNTADIGSKTREIATEWIKSQNQQNQECDSIEVSSQRDSLPSTEIVTELKSKGSNDSIRRNEVDLTWDESKIIEEICREPSSTDKRPSLQSESGIASSIRAAEESRLSTHF